MRQAGTGRIGSGRREGRKRWWTEAGMGRSLTDGSQGRVEPAVRRPGGWNS
ncbi:hypothetical protein G5B47_15340 [Paenibacillus sp. 7124]|uniref:Uncharacterized protein n=1 Tax=Paenibacillus apii TaxID=1850370 RepID=A0A6M1PPW2_9BACL|nr:hypothetical protein [Paenibacillus apii]NGM83793.1 hypothetical protein [Paenibacillus apii]NJJ40679.1 hypothetical protein [Paenibacillus apii]